MRSDYPGLMPDWRYNQQISALRALTWAGRWTSTTSSSCSRARAHGLDGARGPGQRHVAAAEGLPHQPGRAEERAVGPGDHQAQPWQAGLRGHQAGPQLLGLRLPLVRARHGRGGLRGAAGAGRQPTPGTIWCETRCSPTPTPPRASRSTYENRRAIAALALYLERARPNVPTSTIALSSGKTLTVTGRPRRRKASIASDKPLEATVTGGPVGVRVAYQYVPATPGDKVTSLKQGFLVSRGATRLHADGSDRDPLRGQGGRDADAEGGRHPRDPRAAGER